MLSSFTMKQPFYCITCVFLLNIVLIIRADDIWTSFRPGSGYGNRNEFVIKEAVSDETFVLGKDVYSWKSIKHGKCAYAVGLMPHGVTIIKAGVDGNKKRFHVDHAVYDLQQKPMDITLHDCWNKTIKKTELILAVAAFNQSYDINWYKISDDLKMEKLWTWSICKKIHQIEFFKHNRLHKLLVITQDDTNHTSADTYKFNLQEKQFWLDQSIPLANPTKSSAVSISGNNYYLSIPQKTLHSILIFKYTENNFTAYKNITCKNADFVASFRVSFKSYLAIAGNDGAIFEFHKNTLRRIHVEGSTLQGVKFWFPIPVNNFREEVVLLVQRHIETESHNALHLEAVLHNENKFTLLDEFHCKFHGEEMTGLRCMADEDRENGIIGLTTLSVGDTLGLLVPRAGEAPSGLLMLRTGMKSLSSEVNEEIGKIEETKAKLERLLQRRRKSVDDSMVVGAEWEPSAFAAFQEFAPEEQNAVEALEFGVDKLKKKIGAMQRQFNEFVEARQKNQFDTIVFDGVVKVEGNGQFQDVYTKNINNKNVDKLLHTAAKSNNLDKPISSKQFENLKVENLHFQSINDIPAEKLVFAENDSVTLDGNVVFESPVTVNEDMFSSSGKVNKIILTKEIVAPEREHDGRLNFESLKLLIGSEMNSINKIPLPWNYLERISPVSDLTDLQVLKLNILYIPVDIYAKYVNGEPFDEFLSSLAMKNLPTNMSSVLVEGVIYAVNVTNINSLNGIRFPDEFLVTQPPSNYTQIAGKKYFSNILAADNITTVRLNGRNPDNIITLSSNQVLPATVQFENLEITERLFVNDDNIVDENLANLQFSSTLEETHTLSANLSFEDLEIDGTLTVTEDFNMTNFERLLNSVIYKDDEVVQINSVKEFPQGFTVVDDLNIEYNAINNISLSSLVQKNAEDFLQIDTLNGNATFTNLYLTGFYNNINVTKLENDTVKTFGEQYISADLQFDNLTINKLHINNTFNAIPIENYLFIDGDRVFERDFEFETVSAQNVRVGGDIKSSLKNFDIEAFEKRKLSFAKDQLVLANYTITEVVAKKLNAPEINGIPFEDLFGKKATAEELLKLAKSGKLKIQDLHVKGALQLDRINKQPSAVVLGKNVWKNKFLNQNVSLVLLKRARFGHVTVKTLDNVDFDKFTKEIIFKNETQVKFSKDVIFQNGLTFFNSINTKKINGIPLDEILTQTKSPVTLNIPGNLTIKSNVAIATINDFQLHTLGSKLEILDNSLKLKSNNVQFKNHLETDRLTIHGTINGYNISDVFKHTVFVNENAVIKAKTIFQQPVDVQSNFGVKETVDGVQLQALMNTVILKTRDGVVPSKVVFTKPVVVKNTIEVVGNLNTEYLDGCNVTKWTQDALFVKQRSLKGKFTFLDKINVNEDLYAKYINNLDMQYIISLHSEQEIVEPLEFIAISSYRNIIVNNSVNNRNLRSEFENTLLDGSKQTIYSDIEFEEKVSAANAEADALINGLSLKNIVTTYSNQILNGSYNFVKTVTYKNNLQSNGTLNGINFNDWIADGLKRISKTPQNVDGEWFVDGDVKFADNVKGGRVNGLELVAAVDDLERKKAAKYAIEKDVMNDYTKACEDVNHILRESKKQIHTFKYFELLQTTEFALPVQNIHYFQKENANYILVSEKSNCLSHLFEWDVNQYVFRQSIETGLVSQVITVKVRNMLFLVTRSTLSRAICSADGTIIWLFENQTLKLIKSLKTSQLLQNSKRPGAFYSLETDQTVVEYRIVNFGQKIRKYRKWTIQSTQNLIFVPRGLRTGLALISKNELIRLLQDETENWASEMRETLNGSVVKENFPLPFHEMVVLNVGIPGKTRKLLAVASQEKSSIEKGLDLIKIYEDVTTKRLFQNIPSYKPSSLTSVEFENGETLLAFLEDENVLQIYEYKGIEGFKRRTSVKLPGRKLFVVYLGGGENKRTILGVINANTISLLDAVMMGNKLETAELDCNL